MLCVRCSHPLSPRADRCVRCFALNPPRVFDVSSDPAPKTGLSIESDPPAPAAFAIDSEPPSSGSFRLSRSEPAPLVARSGSGLRTPDSGFARTEPDFVEPTLPLPLPRLPATIPFAKPANLELPFGPPPKSAVAPASVPVALALPDSVPVAEPVPETGGRRPETAVARNATPASRLAAWCIDFGLLFLLACAQIFLAARLTGHDWMDLALSRPLLPFWIVLTACDAIACSWLFAAMGRTPGMAALRQHLRTLEGRLPTPGEALQRALLSLLSAAPALFGFSFALFDNRGQTLHDKLCGCVVTVD